MKKINNKRKIFSTGVFLESVACMIDGKKQWRWVAVGFEDESFLDGQMINPIEYSDDEISMVKKFYAD